MAAPFKKKFRGIIRHILAPFCAAEGGTSAGTVQRFTGELRRYNH